MDLVIYLLIVEISEVTIRLCLEFLTLLLCKCLGPDNHVVVLRQGKTKNERNRQKKRN